MLGWAIRTFFFKGCKCQIVQETLFDFMFRQGELER